MAVGTRHPLSKLTDDDVREIRRLIGLGRTDRDIAADYPVTAGVILKIRRGVSWKHVA